MAPAGRSDTPNNSSPPPSAPLPRRGALAMVLGWVTSHGWPAQAEAPSWATLARGGRWPAWDRFKAQFVSHDGRVISNDDDGTRTYSEGQAYGLFFALVANDRRGFDTLLRWTENNLSEGDLGARLPAWLWGRRPDGGWGIIDRNAASDADLWIAYTLGEAARLWKEPRYQALGERVAARILQEETADLPGLGLTLLPGPHGFVQGPGRWKLNPSYLPLQLFHRLGELYPHPAWRPLAQSAEKVIAGAAPQGYVADWILYDAEQGFLVDHQGQEKGQGGYNAIRVYLWAGLQHPAGPGRDALLSVLSGMVRYVREHGHPPESIDILSGQAAGPDPGPLGFSAALMPFLQARGDHVALRLQRRRLAVYPVRPDAYYEQTLTLFALGFMEGWYRFSRTGALRPLKAFL